MVMQYAYIGAGLAAIYFFFTDARVMIALAVASLIAYLLERSGVIQQGPITAMARYFLAIAAFVAIPILLILAFGR